MRLILLGTLLVLGLTSAYHVPGTIRDIIEPSVQGDDEYEAVIDDLIDENMVEIRNFLKRMDPGPLRDIDLKIAWGITQHLTNGWVQNLSLISRGGRCLIRYNDKTLTADLNFAWSSLPIDYRYSLKAGILPSRKGDVHVMLTNLNANVVLETDLSTRQIALKKLNFVNAGKVDVKLDGHKLDGFYNLVLKAMTKLAKTYFLKEIESIATKLVGEELKELNESLSGNKNHWQLNWLTTQYAISKRS